VCLFLSSYKFKKKKENEQLLDREWTIIGRASQMTGFFPNALENLFKTLIVKEKTREFALEGCFRALSNPAARNNAAPLLEILIKQASAAAATTVKRNQTVSALRSLIMLRRDGIYHSLFLSSTRIDSHTQTQSTVCLFCFVLFCFVCCG